MGEFLPQQSNPEIEREASLAQLVEQYFPEDKEFFSEMDFDDALGFVYGQLLEQGEDPDLILQEFGVTEGTHEI